MTEKKWLWLPFDKLDRYQLDTPILFYMGSGYLMDKNEDEQYYTYSIDNDNFESKLFVTEIYGLIKGIQSSTSFIYQDYEFIGQPIKDVIYFLINTFDKLNKPIQKLRNHYYMNLTPVFQIRLVELDDKVFSVILTSLGNQIKPIK
jgi:hypothetical protein